MADRLIFGNFSDIDPDEYPDHPSPVELGHANRLIFGGPSDIDPDEYPTHPSLVELGYAEHAARNPDYNHYGGLGAGVTYREEIPESALRNMVYNANEDMQEDFEPDANNIGRKRRPGAMGAYLVSGTVRRDRSSDEDEASEEDEAYDRNDDRSDDARHGHQIYLGSSMRRRHADPARVALEESFQDDVVGEDGSRPVHGHNWQCAEPGLISEHRYANGLEGSDNDKGSYHSDDVDEDDDGGGNHAGRFYIVDGGGNHMPPCHHDSSYGCHDICAVTGDEDIGA